MALELLFERSSENCFIGRRINEGGSSCFDTIKEFYSKKHVFSWSSKYSLWYEWKFISFFAHGVQFAILESGKSVTAIFASNDILVIAALHVANEKGIKVPKELSIVGMDGILLSEITYPTLTTAKKSIRNWKPCCRNFDTENK